MNKTIEIFDEQKQNTLNHNEENMRQATVVNDQPIGPLLSLNKQKLDQRDLLMLAIENPKYLGKALGHDIVTEGGTGLQSLEQKKEMLKYMYKCWSSLTKFIQKQCEQRGQAIDFPLLGRFFAQNQSEDSKETKKFTFVPHLDFIASGKFKFPQNDSNISPLSKKVPKGFKTITVSLGAIGASCQYDRDLVASILKDALSQFIEQSRKGKEVFMDLKIGLLHAYPNGELQFENGKTGNFQYQNDFSGNDDLQVDQNLRYQPRKIEKESEIIDKNLETLARAMSQGVAFTQIKSCFESAKTPATFQSSQQNKSQSVLQKEATKAWHGYYNDPFTNNHSNSKYNQQDLFSNFSKKTTQSYTTLKSNTQSRLEFEKISQNVKLTDELQKNQFIPKETLDQFIIKKSGGFRPGKKIFFDGKPAADDKKERLLEYLKEIKDRETKKMVQMINQIEKEKKENDKIIVEMEQKKEKESSEKQQKIEKFREDIETIQAERKKYLQNEYELLNQPHFTRFPYTHGDSIEILRAQIKEERTDNFKNKMELMHKAEQDKFDDLKKVLYPNIEQKEIQSLEMQSRLYPQGGVDKVLLREKFQENAPFYLKPNQTVVLKKINEDNQKSAIEQARVRFEQQLAQERANNQKQNDHKYVFMDESAKFQELRNLKNKQSKAIIKSVLEQQIEQDRAKKIASRENRRSTLGGGLTFGPQATKDVLIYENLRRERAKEEVRDGLKQQIESKLDKELYSLQKQIEMERLNVKKAEEINIKVEKDKKENEFKEKKQLKEIWDKQNKEQLLRQGLERDILKN